MQNNELDVAHNNVIKAHDIWNVVSIQVRNILGDEVFDQWFDDLIPITIDHENLVLQSNANHASLWIKNNYQKTLNLLTSLQEENLRTLIISPTDSLSGDSTKSTYFH